MSTRIKPTDRPPCCKPFRIAELIVIATCFTLLFFLRQFNSQDEIICTPGVLIVLFTTIGTTFLIALIDVATQAFREPIPNSPMVLTLLLGSANCLSTGIMSLVVYSKYENSRSHRNLNTLCLLAGGCFLASLLYILDALVVIRYSC